MSTMQKVLLAGALALLLLCSGAGLFGYYRLLPRLREGSNDAVASEVTYRVQQSMENALVMRQQEPCAIQLDGNDLDFSTYTDTSGDQHVNITNGNATIVNGKVSVTADGIDLTLADMYLHGVPIIQDGRFQLADTESDQSLTGFLIDASALETGFEDGVNAGLQRAQLMPVSVQLEGGSMTIGCAAQPAH